MGRIGRIFLGVALVVAAVGLVLVDATAMPGFARRYRFSCQTCHTVFPMLKPYGDDFAANGYRLPEGEPRRAVMDTGDDLLMLSRDFPLGFRFDFYGAYDHDLDGGEQRSDFQTPWVAKILSGGPITGNISYYFYFFFSEHGELAGFEDALITVTDLFGTGINLTVGQFAVSDPIYKTELRLTRENYEAFRRKPSRSLADLKYDRGVVVDYGFDFGLDLVAQVVNGNGIGEAGEAGRFFDSDDYKNVFCRILQSFGDTAALGAFGYWGREENTAADDITLRTNTMTYAGGDFTLTLRWLEARLLYLWRRDTNPGFAADSRQADSHGILAEVTILPRYDASRFVVSALYNQFLSDFDPGDDTGLDYQSGTLALHWLAARNVRLVLEGTWVFEDETFGINDTAHIKGALGVVAGF